MKHLLLTTALLCAVVLGAWAQDETIDFTTQGLGDGQAVETVSGTSCEVTFSKGTNTHGASPKYYTNGGAVRVYANNTMTVTATGGKDITAVEITYASGGNSNAVTVSTGTYGDGYWTGEASTITFTVGGKNGHRRVRAVAVSYKNNVVAPQITGTTPFHVSTTATITATAGTIFYTTDGSTPTTGSDTYSGPIAISSTTTVKAMARSNGVNSMVTSKTFVSDADVWSGSGTAAHPFLISNTTQMDALASLVNCGNTYKGIYFRLTQDLAYDGTQNNYTPVGGQSGTDGYRYFVGTFDGDGHTISGINIATTGTEVTDRYKGVFGLIGWGGIVKNLTVANCYLDTYYYAGGIAGYSEGRIDNCHVLSDVTIHNHYAENYCHGGIVGCNGSTVFGCTSAAKLTMDEGTTPQERGGITGYNYKGSHTPYIYNSLYIGNTIQGTGFCGTIAGVNKYQTADCLYITQSNGLEAIGSSQNSGDNVFSNTRKAFTLTSGTANLSLLFDGAKPNPDVVEAYGNDRNISLAYKGKLYAADGVPVTFSLSVPSGYVATNVTASSGTLTGNADGTYTLTMPAGDVVITATLVEGLAISSTAEWDAFAASVESGTDYDGKMVILTANLGAVTTTVGTEAHPFKGTFDGNGKTLTVSISDTEHQGTAPFRYVYGATIRNLTVEGSVTGTTHTAGLVGFNWSGKSIIDNCNVTASVTANIGDRKHIGGIVGHGKTASLTLKDCVYSGAMTNSGDYAGGLLGWSDGCTLTIDNSLFKGTYSGSGKFHPVAVKNKGTTMSTTICRALYTTAPTLDDASYLAAAGTQVFTEAPAGKVCQSVTAADGQSYYVPLVVSGLSSAYAWTGSPVAMAYTVTDVDGTTLAKGTDYSEEIRNSSSAVVTTVKDKGTYTLTITGLGSYAGSQQFTFTIGDYIAIGDGSGESLELPTCTGDSYSLTQQIYTAAELGATPCTFTKVAFRVVDNDKFNSSKTRNLDIYFVNTDKSSFDNDEWIPVAAADRVFSGEATFTTNDWTTITLQTPFAYDGLGNIAIVVDDNTGTGYPDSSDEIWFATFETASKQSISGDYKGNYDINNFNNYYGYASSEKNQIRLYTGAAPSVFTPRNLTVGSVTNESAVISCTSNATAWQIDVNGTVLEFATNPYTLTGLIAGTEYTVKVRAKNGENVSDWTDAVTFRSDFCSEDKKLTISYELSDTEGDGWDGNAIRVVDQATGWELATWTFYDGGTASGTLGVAPGRPIEFRWVKGEYSDECAFAVSDKYDDEICSSDTEACNGYANNELIATYTPVDNPAMAIPKNLAASDISGNSATLSWTGGASEYDVRYRKEYNSYNQFQQVGSDITTTEDATDYTFDLSSYAGMRGHIAIRHYHVTDEWKLSVTRVMLNDGSSDVLDVSFSNQLPDGWITADMDGDKHNWEATSNAMTSDSYDEAEEEALTPDNWLVTPYMELGGTLTVRAFGDEDYPEEVFGVFVTTHEIGDASWTTVAVNGTTTTVSGLAANTIYEWQVQAKSSGETSAWSAVNTFTTLPAISLADNTDNSTTIAANDGISGLNVTLSGRTLYKDGYWNTLCLPFDVTVGSGQMEGATAMTLNASASGFNATTGVLTLNFDDVDTGSTIAAGTPFIVKWSGTDVTSPVFIGVTINATASTEVPFTGGKFVGTYSPFEITDANKDQIVYLGAGDIIGYSADPKTLRACRAHFELTSGAQVRSIEMNFGDGETTKISITNFTNSDAWFTLDGRRLNGKSTSKGIYVKNGKKVIIK